MSLLDPSTSSGSLSGTYNASDVASKETDFRDKSAVQGYGLAEEERVISLVEEQVVVGKRMVETGTVRLHKHTEERSETVRTPLQQVTWQVEHVPVGRVIEGAPAIRQEGDTTVYPVVEERLVVRREMILVEEVRVTRSTTVTEHESTHTLKREQITEDREASSPESGSATLTDNSVASSASNLRG